ncbi:MAG: 3' terminal RNA ribose 2'-O-methyltransferase Hen1 [Acidobacteriota bacterium]
MILTITTTHQPATDLGYLLHKNPARAQSFDLSFGRAHVFYPEATVERCTAALLLDIDTVGLVRNRRGPSGEGFSLEQYVNDRPYAASSFMSVAIARVFAQALSGKSRDRQEMAETAIPLQAKLAALPCRGGERLLRKLFEPLGYAVAASGHLLDEKFPEWGESRYFTVTLEASLRLSELLAHLYVLIPVLDDEKHYWVGSDEVDKLLRHGGEWLASHPERELIVNRYLKYQRRLTSEAIARLMDEDQPDPDSVESQQAHEEEEVEEKISLNEHRLRAVTEALSRCGARRIIDLGCGEGRLIKRLMADSRLEEIWGMDVSYRALEAASERLRLDRLPQKQRDRIRLIHGSLTYRDRRLEGFDAALCVEVIEHLDAARLSAFERVLFEFARPRAVILTTPNIEYNIRFEGLPAGRFRHRDHRFEWTRREFQMWAADVSHRFGYAVEFAPVGEEDSEAGPPTQMAVFKVDKG